MSDRETILTALFATISPILMIPSTTEPVKIRREDSLPQKIPPGGYVVLFDGDPGEPEVTLSPLTYHYEHRAELIVAVQSSDNAAAFDLLCAALATAMTADRTLGGLCDWVEPMAPAPENLPIENAATVKACRVPVILHYATTAPLG